MSLFDWFDARLYVVRFPGGYHGPGRGGVATLVSDPNQAYKFRRHELKNYPIGEPVVLTSDLPATLPEAHS